MFMIVQFYWRSLQDFLRAYLWRRWCDGSVYAVTVVKALFILQVLFSTTFDKGPIGLDMQGWLVLIDSLV